MIPVTAAMDAMYSEELKNREMMARFEQEVELLTGRTTPNGHFTLAFISISAPLYSRMEYLFVIC